MELVEQARGAENVPKDLRSLAKDAVEEKLQAFKESGMASVPEIGELELADKWIKMETNDSVAASIAWRQVRDKYQWAEVLLGKDKVPSLVKNNYNLLKPYFVTTYRLNR